MRTLVHNGLKLAYEDEGQGDPVFLFVHGWTCDRSFFAPQAEYFARRNRVVSIDLCGHGESDKTERQYSIAAYADDLAYIIEKLSLGKVVAVGHSMGGIIVLQLAVAHPDHVRAIVLVDPAPFVFPPQLREALEGIATAIEAGNQEPRRQFIANQLFLPNSDRNLVQRVLGVMMSSPIHVAGGGLRATLSFDGAAVASHCTVPSLHLAAAVPLNPPHLMSQWLPGVVHGWTVGAGHFSQLEVPGQVNAMIEGFLQHYVLSQAAAGQSQSR